MKPSKNTRNNPLEKIFCGKLSAKGSNKDNSKIDKEKSTVDFSKINFSFLEDDEELGWKDTSVSEQKKLSIQAYKSFAY